MEAKLFELRDAATFIPILCVCLDPWTGGFINKEELEKNRYLLARAGYGLDPDKQAEYILLCKIDGGGGDCNVDPYCFNSRTYQNALVYITANWKQLKSGDVIDIEYILGEKTEKKESERITNG